MNKLGVASIIAVAFVAGCAKHPVTMTRAQLATVERATAACTDASAKLTPYLQKGDRSGAQNAAVTARNACSSSRAEIVAAVGTGSPLDACYFSVDRQEATQQAELRVLDAPTPDNQREVLKALDEAIRQQSACATALRAAAA